MWKLIKSDTNLSQFIAQIENPMMVKRFMLVLRGTSVGTAVATWNVGRIYIRSRNRDLVSADFDFLQEVAALKGGAYRNLGSAAIGAFVFSTIIPRSLDGDDNVELIEPDDNYTVELQFQGAMWSTVTSFNCSLYADVEQGICNYQLLINQQAESFAAAGVYTGQYGFENIVEAYLSARVSSILTTTGSNMTQLVATIGNRVSLISLADLCLSTDLMCKVETQNYVLTALLYRSEGSVSSKLDDKLQLQYTIAGGASYPTILMFGLLINPNKSLVTNSNEQLALTRILDYKQRAGHTASASAVKQLIKIPD